SLTLCRRKKIEKNWDRVFDDIIKNLKNFRI
ncbi:MAG: hypothetical protein RLZZ102_500, partial [Pseudomonadota bacterium]